MGGAMAGAAEVFEVEEKDKPKSSVVGGKDFFDTILPHRGNAQMLDGIEIFHGDKTKLVGIKDIKTDDPWIKGHFPENPIYPGHCRDESFNLTAASLVLYHYKDIEGTPQITSADGVRHKGAARPGDRLYITVNLIKVRIGKAGSFFVFSGDIKNQNGQVIDEYEKVMGAAVK